MDPVKLPFNPKPVLGLIGEWMFTLLAFGLKYSCVCLSLLASIQTAYTAVMRHLPTHRWKTAHVARKKRKKALNKAEAQSSKEFNLAPKKRFNFHLQLVEVILFAWDPWARQRVTT